MTSLESSELSAKALKSLRKLYAEDPAARAILDHLAGRERNWRTTPVDRLLAIVSGDDGRLSRAAIIDVLKKFQELGLGTFVVGRRGHASRFEWDVAMVSVGQYAAQEREDIEPVAPDAEAAESEAEMMRHSYQLRRELAVTFDLPVDLTPVEADRLAKFILTLPLQQS